MNVLLQIEAILFAADHPVNVQEIFNAFVTNRQEVLEADILSNIKELKAKFNSDNYSFELRETGGGYQFLTKANYHEWISKFLHQKANKKLSSAAMETLSIIAYKEPVTKAEIEQIRGVNADYTVHKLLEKELISIAGKATTPGRPVLYRVSPFFLDYFGINSTEELPQLKEIIPQEENTIGELE
ncbi:MAG: SMC-Scp complex subunit ScpB [Chitinophagales bacterium]